MSHVPKSGTTRRPELREEKKAGGSIIRGVIRERNATWAKLEKKEAVMLV